MTTTHFFCAICGSALSVDAAPGRHLTECTRCSHIVPVPAGLDVEEPIEVLPRGVLALDLSFLCPACDCRLRIDARWEDQSLDCPKCARPIRVPRWSRLSRSHVSLSPDELSFLTADDAHR